MAVTGQNSSQLVPITPTHRQIKSASSRVAIPAQIITQTKERLLNSALSRNLREVGPTQPTTKATKASHCRAPPLHRPRPAATPHAAACAEFRNSAERRSVQTRRLPEGWCLDQPLRRRVDSQGLGRADGIFVAYKGMLPQRVAYVVVAYVVLVCIVMAYIVIACIVMACMAMACVFMAYICRPIVRPIAMAYIWPI